MRKKLTAFISSHGYGHATRSSAILDSLFVLEEFDLHIFTQVPKAVFDQSLNFPFAYHPLNTDVGLVQKNALHEDPEATLCALAHFSTELEHIPDEYLPILEQTDLVYADISPRGLIWAEKANKPSVLVENFLWPWIYKSYVAQFPDFKQHIEQFNQFYTRIPSLHLKLEPWCHPSPDAVPIPPVSRSPRLNPSEIRAQLSLNDQVPIVLITMGGFSGTYDFLSELKALPYQFILPGAWPEYRIVENFRLIPHHSEFYHPDLMHASDVIIGKVGYATLTEVLHSGKPFLYIPREHFPESAELSSYLSTAHPSAPISEQEFLELRFLEKMNQLLNSPNLFPQKEQGAMIAAQRIKNTFFS